LAYRFDCFYFDPTNYFKNPKQKNDILMATIFSFH
jgi:hypothetical protein